MPHPVPRVNESVAVSHAEHKFDSVGNGVPTAWPWPGRIVRIISGDVTEGYTVRVVFWTNDETVFADVPYRFDDPSDGQVNYPETVAIPEWR